MRHPAILRLLTPWGWAVPATAAVVAVVAIGHGLGFRWDPFDLTDRRLRAAESRAITATADASARRLEVQGGAEQAARLDDHHQRQVAVIRITERATNQARKAQDATTPLDPARAARLREHDRQLCDLSPAICLAPAPEPAGSGDDALLVGPIGRRTDPGRS